MSSGDDNSTQWSLDLDASDAIENIGKLQEGLHALGEVEGIDSLVSSLTSMGLVVAVVAAAVFVIKETFDLAFDADKIETVNEQFEILARNAGIAGTTLKEGMTEAAGGLISEDDLLQSANKGLVELGANAGHMTDLLQIAKQATQVMGGDLKTNFDGIVQAIASGNTRALKSMGIVIDQNKAYKDYAASIGVATDELSKAGQQHAILNAIMEQAKTQFAGVDGNLKEATSNWIIFKNTMKDVGDGAALAFSKIAGPVVKAELGGLAAMAKDAKTWFMDKFGSGAEAAAAHTTRLKDKIQELKGTLIDLEQKKLGHVFDPSPGDTNSRFQALTKQLADYQKELGETSTKERTIASDAVKTETAAAHAITKVSEVDLLKRAQNQLKYQTQLDALRSKNLADEKKNADSIEEVTKVNLQLIASLKDQQADEEKKVDQQKGLSAEQKSALKVQIAQQTNFKIKAINDAEEADELAALQNFENENAKTAKGFTAAWAVASKTAKNDVNSFAKLGENSINAVQSNFTSAFEAIGNGSKSAGDAMKGAIFGSLGSIAEEQGSVMMLASLYPPDPLVFTAGAALVTLGAFLSSQGGGGGASSNTPSVGSPSSSGASTTGSAGASPATSAPSNLQQAPQKSVTLNIEGNYFDSNQSKMAMMDQLRNCTDATDFNYVKTGGT
jgi:hypothetical protein